MSNPPDLIKQLLDTDDSLSDDLSNRILAAAPGIVPYLIELVAEDLDSRGAAGWSPVHAVRLLGKIADERAVSILFDCLEQCDIDEYMWNDSTFALRHIGEAAIEPGLERYAKAADSDLLNSIAGVLCESGKQDERLFQIATETLERDLTLGANCFYGLNDARALPLLHAKFDEFEVDQEPENLLANQDLIELKAAIEHLGDQLTPEQEQKFGVAMKARDLFNEKMRRFMEAPQRKNKPVVNERKIGRNEPCWCGSGKKYKKCHLPLER